MLLKLCLRALAIHEYVMHRLALTELKHLIHSGANNHYTEQYNKNDKIRKKLTVASLLYADDTLKTCFHCLECSS